MQVGKRTALLGIGVLAAGAVSALVPTATASTAAAAAPTVVSTGQGYITTYADGTKVYSLTHVRQVSATVGSNSTAMSFVPDVTSDGKGTSPVSAMATMSGGGVPSEQAMLKALGASDAVQQRAAAEDTDNVQTAAFVRPLATGGGAPTAILASTWSGQVLFDQTCVANDKSDGGKISVGGCYREWKIHTDGLNWTMLDKNWLTASQSGDTQALTGLLQGDSYFANDTYVKLNPTRSWDGGNCATTTAGLSAYGASVSTSWTQCPETYGEHWYDGASNPRQYQTKWDGKDHPVSGSRDTSGLDQLYSPSGSPVYRGFTWTVWWH